MIVLIVFAFIAGLVTILSPCILPLLPIILASSISEGKPSKKRLLAKDILVYDRRKNGYKENVLKLRRAMEECGFEKVCGECGLKNEWNGKQIVLQIDHKNGDNLDNRPENLGYICPNCQSIM